MCGTTATHTDSSTIAPGDVAAQTEFALDKIRASVELFGANQAMWSARAST